MKFKDIYNLAIELGMEADPRGREGAEKALAAARKSYEKLDDKEKAFFDIDSLTNPYADSRILNGDEEDEAAFVNDEGRHLLHKGSAGAFGSLIHRKILLSRLGCAWGQSSTSS